MNPSFRRIWSRRGFTIYELMIALGASTIFLVAVMNTLYLSARVGQEEILKGGLRFNMEKALERMKHDAHLANSNDITFYPTNADSFTAISLPQALPNTNGLLAFSNGAILWDHTVIYHLCTSGGKTELRRTVFNSFDSNATNRQRQLNNVVANGDGSSGPGGSYSTTTIFSADSASLVINPQFATFDGYAPTTVRSGFTSFGSLVLSSGSHSISFIVSGKNGLSAGCKIGLDSVALSPSGGEREAEALLPASASSGKTTIVEDMSGYAGGPWGGNHQVEYQASAVNDYITLQAYYDMWLESNFNKVTHMNTAVYATNPVLSLASREDQCLSPAWLAATQTADITGGQDYVFAQAETIRCIVSGAQVQRAGNMIRLKFTAGNSGNLIINSAYFGLRSAGTADFSLVPTQLYFDNAAVAQGDADAIGATSNPGVQAGITIPSGSHVWTNWFIYNLTSPSAADFLVSFFVSSGADATIWTDSLGNTQSYMVSGNHASDMTLSSPSTHSQLFASEQIGAWVSTGTATSQVYDTKITAPSFHQIDWTPNLPAGASATMSVRSSPNADMSNPTAWSTGSGASPASLTSGFRYVQWQAIFNAGATVSANYPQIDDVKIDWPGPTQLVEVSGMYTKRPDYGIFKVQVDGIDPIKALEFELSSSAVLKGKTYSLTVKSEESPSNTGK